MRRNFQLAVLVTTGVYYNKVITQKVGLRLPPRTWAEFMSDLQRVKSAGYLAFGGDAGMTSSWWPYGMFVPQFLTQDVKKYATLTYQPDYIPGVMTTEDWARAVIKLGYRPSEDPGMQEAFRAWKDWAQYWNPGWASANQGNPVSLFENGKLAFLWEGSWEVPVFKAANLGFSYGSFWYPPVTRATSTAAPNPPVTPTGVGGYCCGFALPSALRSSPKLPLVVDFLRFITTPRNDAAIVDEHPTDVPAIRGAEGDPAISSLFVGETTKARTRGQLPIYAGGPITDVPTQIADEQQYLLGAITEREFLTRLDDLFVAGAKAAVAQNDKTKSKTGTWALSKW